MKFIVSSSYLLKQLQVLGSVINSSNTLPILDNFLFELDNNQLKVSASDLETTLTTKIPSAIFALEIKGPTDREAPKKQPENREGGEEQQLP